MSVSPKMPPGADAILAQIKDGARTGAALNFEDLAWQLALLYIDQEFVPVVREWNMDIGAGVRKLETKVETFVFDKTGQAVDLKLNTMITNEVVKPFIEAQITGPVDTVRERIVLALKPAFLP